uniref:G protein-coupled receptor n=1 Tax=Panagrellus redivivus TaxID=6233 RepID=A0A7E4UR98_PANRE
MNNFLFDHENMEKYWNCDVRTYDEWVALARPNLGIGLLYLAIGLTYLMIYIPCWISLIKSELLNFSAYKFMAFLGVIDFLGLLNATFYYFYACTIGMVYCMSPTLNYVMGVWTFFGWAASSTTCVLLAISRCIDFISPKTGRLLYMGHKTYYWFLIPFFYSIHIICVAGSCTFNSVTYACSFDPFYGLPERMGQMDTEHYPHQTLAIHNLAIPIILIIIYSALGIILAAQTRGIHGMKSRNLGKAQRNMMFQAMLICSVSFIGALLYSYSNFFPVGKLYTIMGQIGLLSVHGLPGVTYLLFNKTIRGDVISIFCRNHAPALSPKVTPGTTSINNVHVTTSSNQAY